ncbi:MAG: hypothetical protein HY043_06730 [Verrucomicrobia bacterium]|nr:hypothetical protein [Verrucomicrobiota bacterium]
MQTLPIFRIVQLGTKSLLLHKMRSALTMLGMIFGISSDWGAQSPRTRARTDEPTGNLDSKTGVEILDLFDELNASGKTLVLVTHGDEVADRAHRVVHMKDGVIEREVRQRVVEKRVEKLAAPSGKARKDRLAAK